MRDQTARRREPSRALDADSAAGGGAAPPRSAHRGRPETTAYRLCRRSTGIKFLKHDFHTLLTARLSRRRATSSTGPEHKVLETRALDRSSRATPVRRGAWVRAAWSARAYSVLLSSRMTYRESTRGPRPRHERARPFGLPALHVPPNILEGKAFRLQAGQRILVHWCNRWHEHAALRQGGRRVEHAADADGSSNPDGT